VRFKASVKRADVITLTVCSNGNNCGAVGISLFNNYGGTEVNIEFSDIPDELFKREEAELAVNHAEFCVMVANTLLTQKRAELLAQV